MKPSASALCALALAVPPPVSAAKVDVYAVTGARIITVAGPVYERATLVIRDGVIEAVGPEAKPPLDARVIDASGLTLTPGLVDAFGGIGLPPAPTPAASGSGSAGGARDARPLAPEAMAIDSLKLAEALKARDSGITTALVIPREGVLPGQSVLIDLVGDSVEEMVVKQPAALHLHMAQLSRRYPGALMGTVAYARQILYDARRYHEEWAAYEKAPLGKKRPRFSAALAALGEVVAGRETLIVTASRQNDIRRALALADEFKIKVAVAGAPQAHRLAGLIKQRRLPLLVSVNFDPPKPARFFGGEDEEQEKREIEEAEKNPAELQKAGVAFALVSGHAPSFSAGIQKAIERGLPREAALSALTLRAAEALGIADRTGSLSAGKLANVVAWSGEPLAKEAKVKMVFVDGRLFAPEEKPEPRKDEKGGKPEPKPATEAGR